MQTDYNTYEGLRAILEKETPILIAQIRALYRELDKKFHLQGAKVPITLDLRRIHWDPIIRMDTGRKNIFIFHCFL